MDATKECIQEIKKAIGEENVSDDKPTRIVHRVCHGIESLLHEDLDIFTPAAVVRPKTTEDVVKIVNCASKYEVGLVPQGGRTCTYGAECVNGAIAINAVRMDKIVSIDEVAYNITAQAGVRLTDYINFLNERGFDTVELPTMIKSSLMGSRAAISGYNKWETRWGGSKDNIKSMEVVLANGDVVRVGHGSGGPSKSVVGLDTMGLFIGSRGSLGIITEMTTRFIPKVPAYHYGIRAFTNLEDGLNAYLELRNPLHASAVWRTKAYHKWMLKQAVTTSSDFVWPEDVEMLVDYHILGDPEVVDVMTRRSEEICEKLNGFWRDDLPPTEFVGQMHNTMEKFMGMGALQSERLVSGGMGNRIVPLDANIPNSHLIEFYKKYLDFLKETEAGTTWPNLAKHYHVLSPGEPLPTEQGGTKFWALMLADSKNFDKQSIEEFKGWFREYAELIWKHEGSLTATHGFIPKDMEVEFTKRELGETGYNLLKTIKKALDPKNIMNPGLRF